MMTRYKQFIVPIIVILTGLIASYLAFSVVRELRITNEERAFALQADSHFFVAQDKIMGTEDLLTSLKAFLENAEVNNLKQFSQFSASLMLRHPEVQALEWIPRIPVLELNSYVDRANKAGHEDFKVVERSQGGLIPVAERAEYFPVYYVHPMQGNEAAIGFDLGSNSARHQALVEARDTGEAVMTQRITLVQEKASQAGVLVFLPMYQGGIVPGTTKVRRQKLTGFALIVVRVGDLIVKSRANLVDTIDMVVTDAATQESLYDSRDAVRYEGPLVQEKKVEFGRRTWNFMLLPKTNNFTQTSRVGEWLTLFSSVLITALATLFIAQLGRSHETVKKEVALRTVQLRSSEERFKAAVDGSSVGIWDRVNIGEDTEYWSPVFYELLGYRDQEIAAKGSILQAAIHPDDLANTQAMLKAHLNDNSPYQVEHRIKTKDGTYRWFLTTGKVTRDAKGNPIRMAGSIQNIDGRKKAEIVTFEYARDLKRSNEDLEQFAYIASHDLKAPLRAINELANWIEEDLQDVMNDETRSYMKLLKSRVKRLEGLLASLLEYSRLGTDRHDATSVKLNEIIKETTDILGSAQKGFVVEYDLPTIKTIPAALQIIFRNLISNAIKHHHKAEGLIKIQYTEKGNEHIFSVHDDGPGIPIDMQDRVFGMFKTLKSRDTVEGSGMGLAIIKKLVERHGGKVWIENTDGGTGTNFKFSLPNS
ncbi:MAG: hypothetical protein COB37_10240 [Kordiimonadales bacterium]|nr:MAG: hypothetical protein COB37_10240 [Kordiimonadales bacterium]